MDIVEKGITVLNQQEHISKIMSSIVRNNYQWMIETGNINDFVDKLKL